METLYERIGGAPTVDKLIVSFYQHVLADPLLLPFFEHSSIEKLTCMQKAFFSVALGGPEPSEKISLYDAHQGRGIQIKHLTRFTEHLMDTLREIGVEEQDAKRIYDRIATYSNEILGESSVDG
jgi:hemoglobin